LDFRLREEDDLGVLLDLPDTIDDDDGDDEEMFDAWRVEAEFLDLLLLRLLGLLVLFFLPLAMMIL